MISTILELRARIAMQFLSINLRSGIPVRAEYSRIMRKKLSEVHRTTIRTEIEIVIESGDKEP